VLFADIRGSTAIAEHMEPSALRSSFEPLLSLATEWGLKNIAREARLRVSGSSCAWSNGTFVTM
jgi:class 3 adenylate cyclase